MWKRIERFRDDESGAITADWVALTGGLMILAVLTVGSVKSGTDSMGYRISGVIDNQLP